MTWKEFTSTVREHLTVHKRRQGIQTLIDMLIKAAVRDLQSAIPALRVGHTTIYTPSRFTTDGYAGKARIQAGAVITRAYARDPEDHSVQFEFTRVFGDKAEQELIQGLSNEGQRLIAFRPGKGEFRVAPNPVDDTSEVVLVWDGEKSDFEDDDDVPVSWDEDVALVVADFVLARITRQVDQDLALAQSYAGSYVTGKRRLKSDNNEAGNLPGRKY